MTISIWRYSHLILAISSSLFIIIASLTGAVLAFEPISNKLNPYAIEDVNTISVTETIIALQKKYDEISTIEVDENSFVTASVITKEGESKKFYINPKNGEKVGNLIDKHPLFEFATNLHRSLFLKSTGRFLIGFVSFLLLLIALTGFILIAKRQGGFHLFFSKIIKENSNQYYHIIFGRYFLIPIIIITLTGFYLSLEKFSLLPKAKNFYQELEIDKTVSKLKPINFEFFKTTKLVDVLKIEFPFSADEEDYFYVKTIDTEFAIHQFNGQIISQKKKSIITLSSYYSLLLHTGKGSIIWSIILLLACFAILFFVFSGFSMTLIRRKKAIAISNNLLKDAAEFVILVGSETGSTIRFATAFKNALIRINKSVFISELNTYSTYKKAKNIIIFTATYGDGEAPKNAHKFIALIHSIHPKSNLNYAIVGFGSKAYPNFCKFAILVHSTLQIHSKFTPIIPLFKIDNKDIYSFNIWVNEWSKHNNTSLDIHKKDILESDEKTIFKVLKTSSVNIDDTFLIQLKPTTKTKFTHGDLLSITPKNETKNRLYSIAKIDNKIVLSVKKHEFGICSSYLSKLNKNDSITGVIQENKNFHFSKKLKEIILIANGTGIAPFLGMIHDNKAKNNIHLFWGVRSEKSLDIYSEFLKRFINKKFIATLNIAYSKEDKEKVYVQDLLLKEKKLIANTLKNNGVIFICGSLAMQRGVEEVLEGIVKEKMNSNLLALKTKNQIRTDCY